MACCAVVAGGTVDLRLGSCPHDRKSEWWPDDDDISLARDVSLARNISFTRDIVLVCNVGFARDVGRARGVQCRL